MDERLNKQLGRNEIEDHSINVLYQHTHTNVFEA